MNAFQVIQNDAAPIAVTAPFKVDPHRGGHNGEVSRQWASRPADQRFTSLLALRDAQPAATALGNADPLPA